MERPGIRGVSGTSGIGTNVRCDVEGNGMGRPLAAPRSDDQAPAIPPGTPAPRTPLQPEPWEVGYP
jgi:hypothetical protein